MSASDAGHRIRSHTADLMIEAWAPSRARCLEEAVRGLVASFADASAEGGAEHAVRITGDDPAMMLVSLLEEVVYLVDVRGVVPVTVSVTEDETGLEARFQLASLEEADVTGAIPKAIAYHELVLEQRPDGSFACTVTVDV